MIIPAGGISEDRMEWIPSSKKLYQKNWNVHIKSIFAGTDRVIEYLGRYTHRVAISNSRIINVKGDQITFKTMQDRGNASF